MYLVSRCLNIWTAVCFQSHRTPIYVSEVRKSSMQKYELVKQVSPSELNSTEVPDESDEVTHIYTRLIQTASTIWK
jgi:hypothetical protein